MTEITDPIVATHEAIFKVLDSGLSQPVYDSIPDDATYPYVLIDKHVLLNQDNLTAEKESVDTYLSVFSDYSGQKEVIEIMGEIHTLLNRKILNVKAGTNVTINVSGRDTIRDVDSRTFTGAVRLRSLVEHN